MNWLRQNEINDTKSFVYEYIWVDGLHQLRSKSRVLTSDSVFTVNNLPEWNYDGSSTHQADSQKNTEVILKPVCIYDNPFTASTGNTFFFLVLCETYNIDNTPHETNTRHKAKEIFDAHLDEIPWFGLEQEYFMEGMCVVNTKILNTFNATHVADADFDHCQFYCGTNLGPIQRKIADEHMRTCIQIGLKISGINAEVSPQQWEFQIGPCEGIESGDHMFIARFLLERIAEKYNVSISYSPKPNKEINGSGCHINFSTKNTRTKHAKNGKSGLDYIYTYIDRLKDSHIELMEVYGKNNESRLTGIHETSSYHVFTYGVGTRNTSIRIPTCAFQNNCGYLEDRRPGSNIDPYQATSQLFQNCF